MDSSWFRPENSTNIYWNIVVSNENEIGYNFFEAVNYCQSKGSYVSLPSNPEYFNQIFNYTNSSTWIGLSRFGDMSEEIPYDYSVCSANDRVVWERNNQPYFHNDLINNNATEPTECCVKIHKSDDSSTILKSFIDCNEKIRTFICEFSITNEEVQTDKNNSDDQPHCIHCHFGWSNSVCDSPSPITNQTS